MRVAGTQQVHLLVEVAPSVAAAAGAAAQPPRQALAAPREPALLAADADGCARLLAHTEAIPAHAVAIEPIVTSGHLRLLMLNTAASRPRLNGQVAPRIAVLREKDHLQLTPTVAIHIAIYNRPHVGPPPAELLGRECPVCRVPFTADATCSVCPCGAALHCEQHPDGLQCARQRAECPACERPVILQEGYTYWPDSIYG